MKPSHHKDGQELNALLNAPHVQVKQNETSNLMEVFLCVVFSITFLFLQMSCADWARMEFYSSALQISVLRGEASSSQQVMETSNQV